MLALASRLVSNGVAARASPGNDHQTGGSSVGYPKTPSAWAPTRPVPRLSARTHLQICKASSSPAAPSGSGGPQVWVPNREAAAARLASAAEVKAARLASPSKPAAAATACFADVSTNQQPNFHAIGGCCNAVAASGSRLKVAVDVDEVLGAFVDSLNRYYHDRFGERYEVSDYFEYCFRKVWDCEQDLSTEIVHDFFQSEHFKSGIAPIPGAYETLLALSQHVDLEVVTSRQHAIQDDTVAWIEMHFPGIFKDIHFGNHWAKEGKSLAKSEICKNIGAHCLIDDNPGYAIECAEAGINVLLYDWNMEYPWAKTPCG